MLSFTLFSHFQSTRRLIQLSHQMIEVLFDDKKILTTQKQLDLEGVFIYRRICYSYGSITEYRPLKWKSVWGKIFESEKLKLEMHKMQFLDIDGELTFFLSDSCYNNNSQISSENNTTWGKNFCGFYWIRKWQKRFSIVSEDITITSNQENYTKW